MAILAIQPAFRPRGAAAILLAAVGAISTAAPASAAPYVDAGLAGSFASKPAEFRVPVLVTLRAGVATSAYRGRRRALISELGVVAERSQAGVRAVLGRRARNFWLVNAVAGRATRAQVRRLARVPGVTRITLDRRIARTDALSTTPLGSAGSGNWGIADIGANTAWQTFGFDGTGVRIGSIDTGVDASNPALAGRVAAFRDFVNGRPTPYDDNGHGTHTIGTLVGGQTTGTPIGVAPGARVLVAKAMDQNGSGYGSAIIDAAQWMVDPDGNPATADYPTVVNNSWSASDANDPWFRPMLRAWSDLGIVAVFAAGNSGTVGSPAGYPEVIAVGAYDQSRRVPTFSGRGPVTWEARDGTGPTPGTIIQKPDIAAPGVGIMSTYGTGYLQFTGTSMAAPHVAGAVALLRQARPSLTVAEIRAALTQSATDIEAPGPESVSGAGALNVSGALASVVGVSPGLTPPTVAPPRAPDGGLETPKLLSTLPRVANVRLSGKRGIEVRGTIVSRSRVRTTVTQIRGGRRAATLETGLRALGPFRMRFELKPGDYRVDVRSIDGGLTRTEALRILRVR